MLEQLPASDSTSPTGDAIRPVVAAGPRPTRPAGQRAAGVDVEALYVQHRTLLLSVACRKFSVPEADAEGLLQEVFLSFLQTGAQIDNVRAWLVAGICNASRHYWRSQGRSESLPEDYLEHSDPGSHSLPEKRAMEITIQQALGYLQPRCRETLRLHYFDGRSASEVAAELDTTTRYAEKLIHNCLKRVREIYMNITAVQR
ncbi:MAG TPA: sigma-70 family RNA polymerase sigma factor [Thermoanaerobaculia bacterium]|nr:sigma-70 family RNA polymerase sigma factor [Thermoanaerobaculia bacterium]